MLWEFVLFFDSGSSDTPPSYLSLCLFSRNSDLVFLIPSLLPLCQHFYIFFPLETMIVGLMLDYLLMLFITHIQSVSSEFIFFNVSSCHSFWVIEVQSNAIISVTHSKVNQVIEFRYQVVEVIVLFSCEVQARAPNFLRKLFFTHKNICSIKSLLAFPQHVLCSLNHTAHFLPS